MKTSGVCFFLFSRTYFSNLFYWNENFRSLFFKIYFIEQFTVDLQCCINFFCTAKWFSYVNMYIIFHYGLSWDIEYSSLCYTVGPRCSSILCIMVCICQSQTSSPPPNPPPPCHHKSVLCKYLQKFS